jgi:hypothetical protein
MKNGAYKVGMLVDHPARPQWGPGKVVAVGEDRIHVYFRDDIEKKAKTILTTTIVPTVAEEQSDKVLDALPEATHDGVYWMLPKNYEKVMAKAAKLAEAAATA